MIYLDHAAATPVSRKALEAMLPYFAEQFFNPSAPYLPAKRVREAYEAAKSDIARAIGAKGSDLVITSGATESINLAFTVVAAVAQEGQRPQVLTLPTEHAAVLEAAKAGPAVSDFVSVNRAGLVELADLRRKITDDTVLISISLANNELGTIQPLAEVAEVIRTVRADRLARGLTTPLYLHSDASQALLLLDLNVARLGVDLMTISGAKCGGPKGVGALYMAHGVPVKPLTYGGGQERGLRSGTENVAGVVGFAAAVNEAKAHLVGRRREYAEMARTLRTEIEKGICEQMGAKNQHHPSELPSPVFLGSPKHQLANFLPVAFPGIDAERLVYKLEQKEIYVSTGAACAANKGTRSHVLAAVGLSEAEIMGSLRISLGATNTPGQMREAGRQIAQAVCEEYERMRHNQGVHHA